MSNHGPASTRSGEAQHAELTASLERALLRELVTEWHRINYAHFKEALRRPSIVLSPTASRLGRWLEASRTIEIQRAMVLAEPWPVVVEVLKHEMAHQYVHEVLHAAKDESAHGAAFRSTCARLGIDPASSGLPHAREASDPETTRVIERIARLLALAESPNVHEAEAAATAAQRLMLKHNVEAIAQRHEAGTDHKAHAPRDFEVRHLGAPTGRVEESARILAGILGKHYFVEVIWIPVYRPLEGKRGSVLEIGGTRANVAMAEYVHSFLTRACESLWTDHKKGQGLRSNRDRRTFQAGVMSGFASKLARQAKDEKEGANGASTNAKGAAMVWVKDVDLEAWFRKRHPHVRNVRYGGARRTDAFHHGREAGESLVLRKGIEASAQSRGRLLSR